MPHDRKGQVLKEGDLVTVYATVRSVTTGEDYCNLTLESVELRKPDGAKEVMSLNAAVVEKVNEPDLSLESFDA